MAATGFTPIKIYASSTASSVPLAANLDNTNGAELAINTADGRLFYKDSSGVVQTMASKATGSIGGSTTQVQFNNAGVLGGSASLTWSGTVLTSSGFAGPLNGTVGATTANTGAFTTLTASSSITNSSLTTGRIVYTTTGGLETSSANLLYSGTDLTVYGLTVGRGAGAVATNTAVGASALVSNTSGARNTALGSFTLSTHTTATDNTGVGYGALNATTGSQNTAVGGNSYDNNSSGTYNTGLGYYAGKNNNTGSYNTAIGAQALQANTTASNNTAVGYQAAYSNTTGTSLVMLGYQAGYSNTTGDGATFIGRLAGYANTTGSGNIAIGNSALTANTTGALNVAVGQSALQSNTTASNNTAVGYQAVYSNTTGGVLTAIGDQALRANTTGAQNTAVGAASLYLNTTGSQNVAVGRSALFSNTTADNSTAIGHQALQNATGASNTAIGREAGSQITSGAKNTILGTYNGNQGGLDIRTANNYIVLSDGDGNPRQVINSSGYVGIQNTAPAAPLHVGPLNGSGSLNGYTKLAVEATDYAVVTLKAPAANINQIIFTDPTTTLLGSINYYNSSNATPNAMAFNVNNGERMRITSGGSLCVGTTSTTVNPGVAVEPSGRIYIGRSNDDAVAEFYRSGTRVGQINVTTTNTSYNTTSDYRLKNTVIPMTGALAKVALLKPCTYKWKVDGSDGQGFIAHELQEVVQGCVTGEKDAVDAEGNPVYQGIDTSFLVATLTAAIQEQQALIQDLTTRLAALEAK